MLRDHVKGGTKGREDLNKGTRIFSVGRTRNVNNLSPQKKRKEKGKACTILL